MQNYRSFDFLNKLYFVRTGGSPEEYSAAMLIKQECERLGAQAELEAFPVDGCKIAKAVLKNADTDKEYECCGVGMSGSTPVGGITAPFTYVTSVEDAEIQNLEGKICLVHTKLMKTKLYKKLVEKHASAVVLCCGDVYSPKEDVDLGAYMYRARHYDHGKIPAVCIRMSDAEKLLREKPSQVHVEMLEEEFKNNSHNVVATIEGSTFKNEIVAFTAHYDSVEFSKGAYDNATGSTAILQLLSYFLQNKPLRTLKFIWCGSEEMGLLGSKAYVEKHKEELDKYKLCINIDMLGVTIGSDIACCSSNMSLVNYIRYLGCEVGFAIAAEQDVYSSDSTPFADSGVPAVSFARLAPKGGAEIHSHKDVLDFLEEENYYRSCNFIAEFARRLVNSRCFPVEKEIPDDVKQKIDKYYGRKE